ncbi:MAG: GNAT family N-acetyltransferase [Deltaproteobacteria bacterium]|nr:GNAT family N-acetyltransferase [Deltaproteobacteria bacterium]
MKRPMINIRLMQNNDLDAILSIDKLVLNVSRPGYYEQKFERLFMSGEYLPTSLVAEDAEGMVVGFIMGELYIGEYGLSNDGATVDTIGVDPDFQNKGVGELLMNEFIDHLKQLGVKRVRTLVEKTDKAMMHYFEKNRFQPSKTVINLERNL